MIGVCSVGIRLGESNYNCYGFVSPSMPLFEWVVADQATEEKGRNGSEPQGPDCHDSTNAAGIESRAEKCKTRKEKKRKARGKGRLKR